MLSCQGKKFEGGSFGLDEEHLAAQDALELWNYVRELPVPDPVPPLLLSKAGIAAKTAEAAAAAAQPAATAPPPPPPATSTASPTASPSQVP